MREGGRDGGSKRGRDEKIGGGERKNESEEE